MSDDNLVEDPAVVTAVSGKPLAHYDRYLDLLSHVFANGLALATERDFLLSLDLTAPLHEAVRGQVRESIRWRFAFDIDDLEASEQGGRTDAGDRSDRHPAADEENIPEQGIPGVLDRAAEISEACSHVADGGRGMAPLSDHRVYSATLLEVAEPQAEQPDQWQKRGEAVADVDPDLSSHAGTLSVTSNVEAFTIQRCGMCRRERTLADAYDYNPIQVVTGQPHGWYSADDGEVCPQCMAEMLNNQ